MSRGPAFQPLLRLMADFANSLILDAALEYDFFTFVQRGYATAEEVARQAGTDPRATRIVLDSLIALGLVGKKTGRYFLEPLSARFLVRGEPDYVGDFRYVAMSLWDGMTGLKRTLKSGQPSGRLDTASALPAWEKIVTGIVPIVRPAASFLCDRLEIGVARRGLSVLDIAGGSAIFGRSILERDPTAEITQLDWPNVNAVARRLCREAGVEGKVRFIDGEFRSAELPERAYDLVLASNFCRFESPEGNRELFRKANRVLKAGGYFAINDFLPDEERTGPSFPLRFSVYTLTHTPAGECYTLSEYRAWLEQAGFGAIEAHGEIAETLPGTTLILAVKR
jgi:ubiquinone/menaquinone biosynthesis C-methylase UbiE